MPGGDNGSYDIILYSSILAQGCKKPESGDYRTSTDMVRSSRGGLYSYRLMFVWEGSFLTYSFVSRGC